MISYRCALGVLGARIDQIGDVSTHETILQAARLFAPAEFKTEAFLDESILDELSAEGFFKQLESRKN